MKDTSYPLSTSGLRLAFESLDDHLKLIQYGRAGFSWLHPTYGSRIFSVYVNGRRYDSANMKFTGLRVNNAKNALNQAVAHFSTRNFAVDLHFKIYPGTALVETWPVIQNHGSQVIRVSRIDAFSIDLQSTDLSLAYYTSAWGREFELCTTHLRRRFTLQNRSGRSSHGRHPWFGLFSTGGRVLLGSIAWSGNWVFRFEPQELGSLCLSGGMHAWGFEKFLGPGEQMESPACILALGSDLDDAANQYAQVGRKYWYPQNELSSMLPVEWNHWWSYEDTDINEDRFAENIAAAGHMGIEVCTLDAGWFGPGDPDTHWYDYRGDWALVNEARFPSGIRRLAERVHASGMRFGLWCEIEGLGKRARLAETHPDFAAERDGRRLGYVCFGNPAVQEWAYKTLSGFIHEYGCDWLKLDFNLDPGAGCNRTDHGHQAGDGLFEHYRGYYSLLTRIREAFPQVVLENCSSGGLRIDLGILRQTHMTFLSDPDWPVHDLQIFWGASTMIAPNTCLHWSFSDWCMEDPPPQQNFDPHSPQLTRKRLDYYTRISMLAWFGFSQKLPELPNWVAQRLIEHIKVYKDHVRRFVREADLYHLTGQPKRSGQGERWSAFQYSLPGENKHLLFVFRLPGAEPSRTIHLCGLQEEYLYTITDLDEGSVHQKTGSDLMVEGIKFHQLIEEDSALIKIV